MIPAPIIEQTVRAALLEDLGHGRDVTTELLIPGDKTARAVLRARAHGCLAGLIPCLTAFTLTDPDFAITVNATDGDLIQPGDEIAVIEGPAGAMLTAERTGLNFLTHMSGIATLTFIYVDETKGTKAKICCTRKTIPGMRLFQKYAVKTGGGVNHRFGLDDAVLIKDNHIALAGGVKKALDVARAEAGHMRKIAIEVDTVKQLEAVLKHGGADSVLLDNMDVKMLKTCVSLAKGKLVTEASGGVTLENVAAIAKTGVDYISVGALTHSAPSLDIGLDIEAA